MRRRLFLPVLGLVLSCLLPVGSSSALPADAGSTPVADEAGEAPATPFRSFDNTDLEGGDYQALRDVEAGDCIAACRAEARCRAFTYNKWNRRCFLKDRVSELRLEPSSISGVRSELPAPPRLQADITISPYRNRLFTGSPYAVRPTESYADCEALCAEDRQCVVFSFLKRARQCRLLAHARDAVADEDSDSGAKRQPGR